MADRRRQGIHRDASSSDFDQCWELIQDALKDIHTRNAGKLSFEQLYRASYKIVIKKRGQDLYNQVKDFEEMWFRQMVIPTIAELVTKNLVTVTLLNVPGTSANERRAMGEKFLRGIKESWETHHMAMNMVADILMYLDRGHIYDNNLPSIYTVTIGLFRDHILRAWLDPTNPEGASVFAILNAVILDHINMERDGDMVDRNLLRHCIAMLEVLYETDAELEHEKLYLTSFEGAFLENSRDFYRKECARLLREGDARVWLRHTFRRLTEEYDRCKTTTSMLTETKIAAVVESELISAHLDEFLALEGSGLRAMVDNNRLEDLSILYQLISLVDPSKKALKNTLQSRIIEMGLEIEQALKSTDFSLAADGVEGADGGAEGASKTLTASGQQTAAAIKWVSDILYLKEKFDKLWVECFESDLVIQTGLTSSFTELFRLCHRSAEYVSLFIDDSFKRGLRGKSDVEVDATIQKATTMIRHLTDKDMFERYYQKHLGRRLLHNRSEHPEAEMMMITQMQQELGKSFTSKFEGMFKDMATSEEISRNYQAYIRGLGDDEGHGVELSINVLTSNNWPSEVMNRPSQSEETSRVECNYPPEIKRLQKSFTSFYLKDRSGRTLRWVGSTGSADIRCLFPRVPGQDKGPLSRDRRYELNVPTHAMVVLMLFNDVPDNESLNFEEIQARTNIPQGELIRALGSVSIPTKSRVLLKAPLSKQVKPGDRFSFNASFSSKSLRIKAPVIHAVSKVEGEDERRVTEEKNNQTRAHIVDAAIVRTMKYDSATLPAGRQLANLCYCPGNGRSCLTRSSSTRSSPSSAANSGRISLW